MSIKDKLMKIAGKGDFELDPQIRTLYIVRLCVKYGCMLIKGGSDQLDIRILQTMCL